MNARKKIHTAVFVGNATFRCNITNEVHALSVYHDSLTGNHFGFSEEWDVSESPSCVLTPFGHKVELISSEDDTSEYDLGDLNNF